MDGNLFAKNPDPATVARMHAIALHLSARLLGEDAEVYDANGEIERDAQIDVVPPVRRRARWHFWQWDFSRMGAPRKKKGRA